MLTVMAAKKAQAFQKEAIKPALTQRGNEYKPTHFGTIVGLLGGGYAAHKFTNSDFFTSKVNEAAEKLKNAKGFTDKFAAGAKRLGYIVAPVAIVSGAMIAAARLGHTLFDGVENNERRIQADGEAAKNAREAIAARAAEVE